MHILLVLLYLSTLWTVTAAAGDKLQKYETYVDWKAAAWSCVNNVGGPLVNLVRVPFNWTVWDKLKSTLPVNDNYWVGGYQIHTPLHWIYGCYDFENIYNMTNGNSSFLWDNSVKSCANRCASRSKFIGLKGMLCFCVPEEITTQPALRSSKCGNGCFTDSTSRDKCGGGDTGVSVYKRLNTSEIVTRNPVASLDANVNGTCVFLEKSPSGRIIWGTADCSRQGVPLCRKPGVPMREATLKPLRNPVSWDSAVSQCEKGDMYLAYVTLSDTTDPNSQRLFQSLPQGQRVWVGLYRHSIDLWIAGDTPLYEPKTCTVIYKNPSTLTLKTKNVACNETLKPICQATMTLTPDAAIIGTPAPTTEAKTTAATTTLATTTPAATTTEAKTTAATTTLATTTPAATTTEATTTAATTTLATTTPATTTTPAATTTEVTTTPAATTTEATTTPATTTTLQATTTEDFTSIKATTDPSTDASTMETTTIPASTMAETSTAASTVASLKATDTATTKEASLTLPIATPTFQIATLTLTTTKPTATPESKETTSEASGRATSVRTKDAKMTTTDDKDGQSHTRHKLGKPFIKSKFETTNLMTQTTPDHANVEGVGASSEERTEKDKKAKTELMVVLVVFLVVFVLTLLIVIILVVRYRKRHKVQKIPQIQTTDIRFKEEEELFIKAYRLSAEATNPSPKPLPRIDLDNVGSTEDITVNVENGNLKKFDSFGSVPWIDASRSTLDKLSMDEERAAVHSKGMTSFSVRKSETGHAENTEKTIEGNQNGIKEEDDWEKNEDDEEKVESDDNKSSVQKSEVSIDSDGEHSIGDSESLEARAFIPTPDQEDDETEV